MGLGGGTVVEAQGTRGCLLGILPRGGSGRHGGCRFGGTLETPSVFVFFCTPTLLCHPPPPTPMQRSRASPYHLPALPHHRLLPRPAPSWLPRAVAPRPARPLCRRCVHAGGGGRQAAGCCELLPALCTATCCQLPRTLSCDASSPHAAQAIQPAIASALATALASCA